MENLVANTIREERNIHTINKMQLIIFLFSNYESDILI